MPQDVHRAARLDFGRKAFDDAGYRDGSSNWHQPADREHFARAFAAIDAPMAGRPGVVERMLRDDYGITAADLPY